MLEKRGFVIVPDAAAVGAWMDAGTWVIGPFASEAEATTYLTAAETDIPCTIKAVLAPIADPTDDADLHP